MSFSTAGGRAVCPRCRRPQVVCYCAHVRPIATASRVVLLQHPRERDMPIGTAHMASLCLPASELHVGVDWEGTPVLTRLHDDPERPPVLLYPGDDARDILQDPPRGPVTLVVIDGTWWQARKVVRRNPSLAALPRYAFRPPRPSEYRIRREPSDECVSTLEALVHVLGALEGGSARFEGMLDPFRAMIDAQLARVGEGQPRRRRMRSRPSRPPAVPQSLRERPHDVVVVAAEANAWPYRAREASTSYPDELVQWVACRVTTGETFDGIVRPRYPLAPRTCEHTGLSPELLDAGSEVEAVHRAWDAFVRPRDVIVAWGHYGLRLFLESGGALPASRVDLRHVARQVSGTRVGTLEAAAEGLPHEPKARGRGGLRAALLQALVRSYSAER